ncbi:Mediator complex, subunit Med13 [Metarhizium album ARSEF 1941]|uniref:Mediator of RNA polymerase II transcription subunit 13 n=1 Tax=Metarhizium album (strain ARSEF 1941) TaxID=1081103 RepID=A0A0B2X5S5_METAS|nr:Mediator complex, subunit Med13 [Metarhizium album ARSEF 1941]KHO01729.1 Mediator complex, subunit Med13 [Metarhizium album ARSEF 1941]
MDVAEYDTNVFVVNNIASISFRVYEPSSDQSSSFGLVAVEIEKFLREKGHVVYYDASKRGIWHFRIVGKEGNDEVSSQELDSSLSLRGYSLNVGEEGYFEPSSLPRARSQQPQAGHTPTSSTSSAPALDQSQRHAPAVTSHLGLPGLQEQDSKGNTSVLDAKSVQGGPSPTKAYESFIIAALSTIQSAFCSRTDSIPLNYRTVLLSQYTLGNCGSFDLVQGKFPTIGTFSAYLTTTGVLVVCINISVRQGLLSYSDSPPGLLGQQILAAPFGMIASNQSGAQFDGGTASMVQTPNTQAALSLRGAPDIHNSLWKQACLKFLQLRGVAQSKFTDCFWMNLLISGPKLQDAKNDVKRLSVPNSTVTIPWPSPLCFRKRPVEVSSTSRVGETILRGHEESHDPLGNAQFWFSSTSERDEKISKRKAERAAVPSEGFSSDSRPTRPNGQSPLTLRRLSTAAAGSVYPTPPDALQNAPGVTPSLDGTLSSPGNPLSAAALPEADNNGSVSVTIGASFEPGRDLSETKRQRSDSNLLGEAEHMFGDMGEDMFGDNDITEADFNFFDEEPGSVDLEATFADMGAATTDEIIATEDHAADEEMRNAKDPVEEEQEVEKDNGGFTKPELRHAISVRNDNATSRGRDSRPVSMKRESSPFDPHTVFKRVRASLATTEKNDSLAKNTNRMTKIFEKMDFDPALPMINKKYEQGGQYDYRKSTIAGSSRLDLGLFPETDCLRRFAKAPRGFRDQRSYAGSLMGPLPGLEPPLSGRSPTKLDTQISDDEQSSTESDQDDSSYTSDEPTSPLKSSIKQAPAEDDVASQVTSTKEQDMMEEPDHQLAAELPRLAKPETPELPLSKLFSDPEPLALELALGDEDLIQVAQILTEQAATGSLDLCNMDCPANTSIVSRSQASSLGDARTAIQQLGDALPLFLRGVEPVRLKAFLDIQDVLLQGQPRMQPRPMPGRDANAEQMRPSNLYQIPGPHLEVRRSEAKLSVLPSAVAFWESLGLAPSSGNKDITAVCVFPGWKGMADNAKTFLGRVKSVYEVLRLGSFENMTLAPDMDAGLLPYEVDRISTSPDATLTGHGSALIGSMETLRGSLSSLTVSDTNVVVYFVYSPNNPGTIVEACAAFQRFFDSYQMDLAAKKETAANELVLQLVSSDLLSSPTSVVVTPSVDLARLCMETYDRCTLFGGPMPAPAIRLEQPLPRIIDFKLNTQPSVSLIRENSCIHVAYAQTVDGRWVTSAWTDDRGNQQATASYCLGRKGRPLSTPMDKVAHEIWESTLDLISAWKVHWRIIITKCGPMDQQEIDFWVDLARTEIKLPVTMILMTADTDPWLQLVPPVVRLPQPSVPFYTTPVSTPQANIVSPEQSATPATPGGGEAGADSETDAVLADVTDQTWGAIVGHRLNNSSGVTDLCPALVSGFLIKRTGARAEDVPVAMEVNLIHTEALPRSYEPLLREMLSYFRGLATLSRARGMVPREMDVRPWHVAAAEKAARAMYLLM